MPKLSYKTQRAIDEIGNIPRGILQKLSLIAIYFVKDMWYNYPYVWWGRLIDIKNNIKFFAPHVINRRTWDYQYSLDLFCDSLEELAKGIHTDGHLGNEKRYRRCLFAAARLRAAYDDRSYNDKSYVALVKANPVRFEKCRNGGFSTMVHDHKYGEEYYTKMLKLINKRIKRVQKENKRLAWEYIHKHIESWWD